MSWAEEDWTVGLSGRVLQKVKELQVHQERLSRENKQKQLQLDNIHTSLEKQTVKYEEVRSELQAMHRELQSAQAEVKVAVTSRERLSQDLQTKQAQVCSLEGQLDASRSHNNKLTQEVKRLEAELEKLQNSTRSADTSLFSTPCWSTTSPWEQSGSRKEERYGQRDEGQTQGLHVRQRLQFSDMPTGSLPRQQPKTTPHRHPSNQSDVYSTPSAAFPWERDDSKPAARRRSPATPQTPYTDAISHSQSEQEDCGKPKDARTQEIGKSLSELQRQLSIVEEELRVKSDTLKSLQNEVAQSKKELSARELNLQRARDELSMAHTRIAKESERASGAEQRLKQLQEELKCQRQNSESSRLQHQQRTKEVEKQHQRDLLELQKERQHLEKQHQQEVNKLNQELAQARTLYNALQAQADKVSLQKQALDKELETLSEKLKWTEGQLQQSQKKETQTQAKLMEALREVEGVAVSLEQSRKNERALEEEGRRLAEERDDALRLLKDLQEQKAVPEPLQAVQFCPVGQNFSTQTSVSHQQRPSNQTRRPNTTNRPKQRREEEEEGYDESRAVSYPTDREPGEGIDSEHITTILSKESECLQREGPRKKTNEGKHRSGNEVMEYDSSGTNRYYTCEQVLSTQTSTSMNVDNCTLMPPADQTSLPGPEPTKDLLTENATLRSELRDVREELQKRLEDLETQRRAEAEARTRLKQLSRKNATQSVEKEEQYKECKAQLEREKAETERLKKSLAALETELKKGKGERDKGEHKDEMNKEPQDREEEMIELNIQLKKQLVEVKAQLALEREERKQEEERIKATKTDMDLNKKLAELLVEIEELKRGKEDSMEEEKLSLANSPLTYLTLHEDELNSNIVDCDTQFLPLPEQHLVLCQSTNQHNTLISQSTAGFIQKDGTQIYAGPPHLFNDKQLEQLALDQEEETPQNYLGKCSDQRQEHFDLQKDASASSELAKEVEHLQRENARETERANQCQVKLEALQNQVTQQTQHLTMAFERQSLHISGLLAELQEKESTLLRKQEELQLCKQELNALKSEKHGDDRTKTEEVYNIKVGGEEQRENKDEVCSVTPSTTSSATDDDSDSQKDSDKPSDVETPGVSYSSQRNHHGFIESVNTQIIHDSIFVKRENGSTHEETASIFAELLTLRQENQSLKKRFETLTVSDPTNSVLQPNDEISSEEQRTHSVPSDIHAQACITQQDTNRGEDEGSDLCSKGKAEEGPEAVSQRQINRLQQQMVELQAKLKAFYQENQQQAEEIAVWRLASGRPPTFNQNPSNTDSGTKEQSLYSAVIQPQSNQQQAHNMPHIFTESQNQNEVQTPAQSPEDSQRYVTLIREDEFFLSCSSNKMQGRTLFSRLQHSNVSEPKNLHPFTKTSSLQEHIQDNAEQSEKENTCPAQHKQKKDTEHVTKDFHKALGPQQTKTSECPTENPNCSTVNTILPSNRGIWTDMRSVNTQTEEHLYSLSLPTSSVQTQTEEEEENEEIVESPPVSPTPRSEVAALEDKMFLSGSFPIPADPARLAERIRRNRTQLSAAFDDTEYEPYGLPEVVMKGFADIPSGPSCPYIVRRGLLGTTVVPAQQNDPGQAEETD